MSSRVALRALARRHRRLVAVEPSRNGGARGGDAVAGNVVVVGGGGDSYLARLFASCAVSWRARGGATAALAPVDHGAPVRARLRRYAPRGRRRLCCCSAAAGGDDGAGGARSPPPEHAFPPELYGAVVSSSPSSGGASGQYRSRTSAAAVLAQQHDQLQAPRSGTDERVDGSGSGGPFVSEHYRLKPGEVAAYLERKGMDLRKVDKNVVARVCPFCPPTKGKFDNLYKLYVHAESGVYFCHRCSAKGGWWDLKRRLGDIVEPTNWLGQEAAPDVAAVNGDAAPASASSSPSRPLLDACVAAKFEAALSESPAVRDYLLSRGLSETVVKKYRVGAAQLKFDEGDGAWRAHDCVTFPWIEPTMPTAVRAKARSIARKSAMRLEPRGGRWGLFGMHTVPESATSVVLTEGEFDAMAVHQATGMPAVSLPNGASSLPPDVLPMLERFKKIYLWLDDDVAGQEGARQFANKLGIQRCVLVSTRDGSSAGPKDANEALLAGHDLQQLVDRARPVPHERIVSFAELRDDVQRELANPLQVRGIQSAMLPGLNRILKGHRRGELSVFSGSTGIGKTTVLSQMSLDYCQQGVSTLWGSFELNNVRMAKIMLSQFAGVDAESLMGSFDAYAERFEQLPLYFLRFFGSSEVDKVIDAMEYAVYVYDVSHVVLDNLQFMTSGQGRGYEKFEVMDRAVEKFRAFSTQNNVHVSLVIHPRKEDDDQALKTSSVFGTAKATQEADNVVIVQNGQHFKYLDVRKNRYDGELGNVPYRFDAATKRIVEIAPDEAAELEDGFSTIHE